jgi:hypothetical protein
VPRSIEYNWSTELILLSVRALDEFVYSALECFWALWKVENEAFPMVPSAGQMDKWKGLKTVSRQQMCQSGRNQVRIAYGNLGGKWEMGQERE